MFIYTVYNASHPHLYTIQAFYRNRKRMPTYSELMAITGFRSTHAASMVSCSGEARGL